MKKSLIALAVAGVVSAPAFAATNNVEFYGKLGVSVDMVTRDKTGTSNEFLVSNNNSNFGLKGSEDLGGGLSAIWQVETRVGIDDGEAFTAGEMRNTFVGVASKDFGSVRLGRYDTAYKRSTGKYDPFSDSMGDYNAIMGADAAGGSSSLFDIRETNSISYDSPVVGGLSANLTYGQRNEAGATTVNPQLWSVGLSYVNGPFSLAAAYEAHDDNDGTTYKSFLNNRIAQVGGAGAAMVGTSNDNAWRVGGGYTFGDTTVAAVYERLKSDGTVQPLVGASFATSIDRNAWYVSATHKLGAVTLKGAYAQAGDTNASAAINDGARQWTLGADYNLSKRTYLFAYYSSMTNDPQGAYTLGASNKSAQFTGNGAGNDPHGVSLGVRHSF